MKAFVLAAVLATSAVSALAAEVGVSVAIAQPGFYGRIDIANLPPPQLIYRQPVVIEPVRVEVVQQPIYLYVPPKHAKNWRKNCHRYNACGQPVYFVSEGWYNDVYVKSHGKGHDKDHGKKPKKN